MVSARQCVRRSERQCNVTNATNARSGEQLSTATCFIPGDVVALVTYVSAMDSSSFGPAGPPASCTDNRGREQSCEWPLAELAASLLRSCEIRKKSSLCLHLFVCQLLALTIFKTIRIMKARCFQVQHKDSIKISWHCSMNISWTFHS